VKARRKPRVVAVDDDKDFLSAVRKMLEPAYEVTCLSDGHGLPEQVEGLDPDLLLLDLHMPEIDGVEVCRRVRADPRFADLPVVFLTGSKADEDFVATLQAGAWAFLAKPIGAQALRRRIAEALSVGSGPGRP
jgi:CheY-like chemotaxis protein